MPALDWPDIIKRYQQQIDGLRQANAYTLFLWTHYMARNR